MSDVLRLRLHAAPLRVRIGAGDDVRLAIASLPVAVRVAGAPGPQGAPGEPVQDWTFFVTQWSAPPALAGTATVSGQGGAVYSYTLEGVTRFRFVPDAYDPSLDAFYSAYAGGALSGLIVARAG